MRERPKVVCSKQVVVQCRFPKSKKKRTRKKWAKMPCNNRPDSRVFFLDDKNVIVCHPDFKDAVEEHLDGVYGKYVRSVTVEEIMEDIKQWLMTKKDMTAG